MSTSINVKIYVTNRRVGEKLIKSAFEEAKRIEYITDAINGDGELRRINARGSRSVCEIGHDLYTILEEAFFFYNDSGGAFDPTIAQVKWLWGFENGGKVPDKKELRENLAFVGLSLVELSEDSLYFKNPETKLDLGGIAKGYAVDKMIQLLKKGGVKAGLVNAGGDIATFGKKPGDKDWVIGLRHPRMNRTLIIDATPYTAIATSGDYERSFIENGERFHHILDPVTGYPVRHCISVTVWTKSAMIADILSTTIFVLGPEKGLEYAEKLDDVETLIFFEHNGKVGHVLSSGVKDKVQM